MKAYILTMRIEADDDINEDQIQGEVYEACAEVPFGFTVTSVEEQRPWLTA